MRSGALSPTWEQDERLFVQQIAGVIRARSPRSVEGLDDAQVGRMISALAPGRPFG